MSWKSCYNCADRKCAEWIAQNPDFDMSVPCDDWQPIPCPICGGALSEIMEHNGKKYRHCYACHAETEEDHYEH
jgi:hypothetical protein